MRFLTSADVEKALPMKVAIDLMRRAFIDLANPSAHVPVRSVIRMGDQSNQRALVMPAYLPSFTAGLKLITVSPNNSQRGLPTSHAVVVVVDQDTGEVNAIIEAEALTAIRTGAGSGLATDLLASSDAAVVAIFGAGKQAATQLEAVCAVRPIERALVFNRTISRAEQFAEVMSGRLGIEVVVAHGDGLLYEADVICTATASTKPVLHSQHLKAGAHINGVGSYRPDMAEIPEDVVVRSFVVADHTPACLTEAGDIIQPIRRGAITEEHIMADLGEILTLGMPERRPEHIWTFFKSVGNACQDIACGDYLARYAEEHDLGLVLPT